MVIIETDSLKIYNKINQENYFSEGQLEKIEFEFNLLRVLQIDHLSYLSKKEAFVLVEPFSFIIYLSTQHNDPNLFFKDKTNKIEIFVNKLCFNVQNVYFQNMVTIFFDISEKMDEGHIFDTSNIDIETLQFSFDEEDSFFGKALQEKKILNKIFDFLSPKEIKTISQLNNYFYKVVKDFESNTLVSLSRTFDITMWKTLFFKKKETIFLEKNNTTLSVFIDQASMILREDLNQISEFILEDVNKFIFELSFFLIFYIFYFCR